MAITFSNVGFTTEHTSGSALSSFTTSASLSPTSGRLIGVFVMGRGDSGVITGSPTLTGAVTWSLHKSHVINEFGSDEFVYFFRSDGNSPSAAPLVFTMPASETFRSLRITAVDMAGAKTTGTNGSDGFVTANDTVTSTDSGADPYVITYNQAFASATNGGLAGFLRCSSNESSTPKTGWTELSGSDGATGLGGSLMCSVVHYKASSDTTAEADYTTNATVRVGMALEVVAEMAAAVNKGRPAIISLNQGRGFIVGNTGRVIIID